MGGKDRVMGQSCCWQNSHKGGGMVTECCWWEGQTWEEEWARESPNVGHDGQGSSVRAVQEALPSSEPSLSRQAAKNTCCCLGYLSCAAGGMRSITCQWKPSCFPRHSFLELVAGGDGPGMGNPPAKEGRVLHTLCWDWTCASSRKWYLKQAQPWVLVVAETIFQTLWRWDCCG